MTEGGSKRAKPLQGHSQCPGCQSGNTFSFYQVHGVPAHSVLLMETAEQALNYPKADIDLHYCRQCDFVFNSRFDHSFSQYGSGYEETQHCSTTFSKFAEHLCDRLIDEFGVQDATILEIGCGKGEFLAELCLRGNNRAIGMDPSCAPERLSTEARQRIEFQKKFFGQSTGFCDVDVVVCRHTLEHIAPVETFVSLLRDSISPSKTKLVFFEVPALEIILREQRFWDVYYEHCSYFTRTCLQNLFLRNGFKVIGCEYAFAQQYLLLFARPVNRQLSDSSDKNFAPTAAGVADGADCEILVPSFSRQVQDKHNSWKARLADPLNESALWGSGSKCVSLLTTLSIENPKLTVVDINPLKQGKFLPGTELVVSSPESLVHNCPDTILVMNPVYESEIGSWLQSRGLRPHLEMLT